MSFELHIGILLAGLAAFALWPNIWRGGSFKPGTAVAGTACNFKQQRVSRSNRVQVTVTLECDPRFQFTLRRENDFDRFAKIMRLVREFQTNDERFDEAIYIGGDERGIDEWLASDQTARGILLDLLCPSGADA